MKNIIDRNAALYNALNDIDDRRERLIKASSTGRHEPASAFGGLYDVEDVDDGGRLIERTERGVEAAFIPVAELPDCLRLLIETGDEVVASASLEVDKETLERMPHEMRLDELRLRGAHRPAVIVRRRTALRAH